MVSGLGRAKGMGSKMKKIIDDIRRGFFEKEHFGKRLMIVIAAVIMMGFALSFLILADLGTDPCTMMNRAISAKLGMSFGNWQALLNTILLVAVVLFGGRNLGFGTLANMFLVGYSTDFFSWLIPQVIPVEIFRAAWVRGVVFVPALVLFILAASVYMDVDMGTAPYDAISFILSERLKRVPFTIIRIAYDFLVIGIALLFGAKLQIVTVLMAVALGPVISFLGPKLERWIYVTENKGL